MLWIKVLPQEVDASCPKRKLEKDIEPRLSGTHLRNGKTTRNRGKRGQNPSKSDKERGKRSDLLEAHHDFVAPSVLAAVQHSALAAQAPQSHVQEILILRDVARGHTVLSNAWRSSFTLRLEADV